MGPPGLPPQRVDAGHGLRAAELFTLTHIPFCTLVLTPAVPVLWEGSSHPVHPLHLAAAVRLCPANASHPVTHCSGSGCSSAVTPNSAFLGAFCTRSPAPQTSKPLLLWWWLLGAFCGEGPVAVIQTRRLLSPAVRTPES